MQRDYNVVVMNSVCMYEGYSEVLFLMILQDKEIVEVLGKVFLIYGVLLVDLEEIFFWDELDVGDCCIGRESVILIVEGVGGVFMGMCYEVYWGRMLFEWYVYVECWGCVWFGFVDVVDYIWFFEGGWIECFLLMWMLKLEVIL